MPPDGSREEEAPSRIGREILPATSRKTGRLLVRRQANRQGRAVTFSERSERSVREAHARGGVLACVVNLGRLGGGDCDRAWLYGPSPPARELGQPGREPGEQGGRGRVHRRLRHGRRAA